MLTIKQPSVDTACLQRLLTREEAECVQAIIRRNVDYRSVKRSRTCKDMLSKVKFGGGTDDEAAPVYLLESVVM